MSMTDTQFTGTGFYAEFADKSLLRRNDWRALIAELQAVYGTVGMKLPELDSDDVPGDIDPFTVFGLFNKGITDANRKRIAVGVA